jgi:hypothetical protein
MRRDSMGRVLVVLGGLLVLVIAGWFNVRDDAGVVEVEGTLAAAGMAVLLWKRAFGVMLALAILVDLNGVAGVNVDPSNVLISRFQDLSAVGVVLALFYVVASGQVAQRSSLQRKLYLASFALAAWWFLTWARTAAFEGIPPILAAKFARDFLYFAVTLPLLVDAFVTYPRLRRQVLWTLGPAAAVYAVAQIAQSRGHVSLGFILHPNFQGAVVLGTSRVYSPMNVLVRLGLALSLGALILASTRRLRRWAAAPALLFGTAMLLQLTRAAYFGAAVGFVVAGTIWWFRRGPIREIARRHLILVPVIAVCLLGAGAVVSAGERHVISTAAARILAGYSDVNSTTGTVAVRVDVGNTMIGLLGQDWPIGLGFMHPAAHPYPSLPNGSIRDPDLGVLNALMLMGAVGTILLYLPLLLILRALARAPAAGAIAEREEWLRLGSVIWIVGVIASSLTLGELFSFGGLELSACALAIAASIAVSRGQQAPAAGSSAHGLA